MQNEMYQDNMLFINIVNAALIFASLTLHLVNMDVTNMELILILCIRFAITG